MDAHVVDYLGSKGTHFAYNDAKPVEQAGHSAGYVRFFDNTYTQVGSDFGAEGDLRAPDIHELNIPGVDNGETFIQDVYEIRAWDMSPYRGPRDGYILDGCFQEVSIRTKKINFEWCALDWIPPYDTYMYPHGINNPNYSLPIAGNGTRDAPWDFFHINAIAKNLEGDYAISSRHLNTIYKLAGLNNNLGKKPGEIIWRLGGKHSDFQMTDFNFSRQHTVRFHSTGPTKTVLTFFDNAFDGWSRSSKWSTGKIVQVDNSTWTANLMAQYDSPDHEASGSQGSLQILPNSNVFLGWGNRMFVSEHEFDGKLLFYGEFTAGMSFRAWKHPWIGYPTWKPKVLGYAANCTDRMYAYASWNGATEVAAWRFWTSVSTRFGPWRNTGTWPKQGFETLVNFTERATDGKNVEFVPFIVVEALDRSGYVLGTSEVTKTFVPNMTYIDAIPRFWKNICNETQCDEMWFHYPEVQSCASGCGLNHRGAWVIIVILVVALELITWALELYWGDYVRAAPLDIVVVAPSGLTGGLAFSSNSWLAQHVTGPARPGLKRYVSSPAPVSPIVYNRPSEKGVRHVSGVDV